MHYNEMKESRFLKKEDCGQNGILVTIKAVVRENMAKRDEPEELKWCLEFEEDYNPLTLNSTNGQLVALATGQDDTDNWPGHKIVCYNDPSVMMKGKIVGGIRVRAPRGKAAVTAKPSAPAPAPQQRSSLPPSQQPQPEEMADTEDDVPF